MIVDLDQARAVVREFHVVEGGEYRTRGLRGREFVQPSEGF